MIPRYTRAEMADIWTPQTRFRIWFEIEAHAADAMAELGLIPKEAAKTIWERGGNARFDIERIETIEREVKHDVIAFLTHLAEIVGPDARFVHQGLTSSDVLDTCFSVQLARAADLLVADIAGLLAARHRQDAHQQEGEGKGQDQEQKGEGPDLAQRLQPEHRLEQEGIAEEGNQAAKVAGGIQKIGIPPVRVPGTDEPRL